MMYTIAVDAMGGDSGPRVIVPAVVSYLRENKNIRILLVGDKPKIMEHLKLLNAQEDEQLQIHHASETVTMDEEPGHALRFKKDSSMRVVINLVKEGFAQACVSAGNTGALMAIARFVLKTVEGIDRPAIISRLPTLKGDCHVLDLGANVDCTTDFLFQFALMGSVLSAANLDIEKPKVALLNIGAEEIKGNEQVRAASKRLSTCKEINYVGFVEGDDIYKGTVDVIVCDGFVGNIALKTSEGLAKLLGQALKNTFTLNWRTKIIALFAKPLIQKVSQHYDPRRYNGASLIGLKGIVIKSHGSADIFAFKTALTEAEKEIEKNIPQLIETKLSKLMSAYEE